MKALRVLGVLALLAVAGAGYALWAVLQPYQGFTDDVFVEIPPHTGSEGISRLLAAQGVIRKPWMFLAARLMSRHSVLQAGEYHFISPATPLDVMGRIARGDTYYQVLKVPEGYNMFDIAKALAPLHLVSPESFLGVARRNGLIKDLDPDAPSLEGYLYPDSYHVNRHSTAEMLCLTMTNRFRQEWKSIHGAGNPHKVITLASLVEREAKLPEERPLVASVFTNRLKLGMKLDCDPTTVYAALLRGQYRGKIYKSDLESEHPYNTYAHAGLPPGPIANPGMASIKAAMAPAASGYLYFVAKTDGSGGHNFSESLHDHLAATALLREAEKRARE